MPFNLSAVASTLGISSAGKTSGLGLLEQEVVSLFEQFRAPLLRYLASFGLSVAEREDIVQEVFLALFLHLRQGKPRTHLRAWLFKVAHNLALKRPRQTIQEGGAAEILLDPGPSPEDLLLAGSDRERLRSVFQALPVQDRRCLFLRAEGFNYRKIAGMLDMSLGAVSVSVTRSLERLSRATRR